MPPSTKTDEPLLTLPTGHPQAGYVSPDLSLRDGTGTLPAEEQEWHDDRNDARQAEVDAVAAHEDSVVREEIAGGNQSKAPAAAKTPAAASTGS